MRIALTLVIVLSLAGGPLSSAAQEPARVAAVGLFHIGADHTPSSLDGLREGLKASAPMAS